MPADNSDQIAEWNGVLGERWAQMQMDLDRLISPYGEAGLKAAAVQPGERILDIGCGCGDTSLALARATGPEGSVLGVDVSRPMLEVARARAGSASLTNLSFVEADAATGALPSDQDLVFSRFGIMFFAAPVPAFAHIRRALRDSGRITFVCWRSLKENPWAMAPVSAARQVVDLAPANADPHAPGPFAFADADRVRMILLEGGFRDVGAEPVNIPMYMGATARSAAEGAARTGPLGRIVREAGPEKLPAILAAVEAALAPHATANGVSLTGSVWVVTAKAG
jgi:SAM-dependent methyltransferase